MFSESLIKVKTTSLTRCRGIWREHNFHRGTVQTGKMVPSQSGMNAGARGGHSKVISDGNGGARYMAQRAESDERETILKETERKPNRCLRYRIKVLGQNRAT